jgi:hypothetical protein
MRQRLVGNLDDIAAQFDAARAVARLLPEVVAWGRGDPIGASTHRARTRHP